MKTEGNKIIAEEGKVLRRKSSGELFGKRLSLGYSHYIGGVRQIPPYKDSPEDFEEIDAPERPEKIKKDVKLSDVPEKIAKRREEMKARLEARKKSDLSIKNKE